MNGEIRGDSRELEWIFLDGWLGNELKKKKEGGGDNLGGYGVGRGESLIKTGPSINLEKDVAGELFYLRNFSRYRCK